MSSLYMAILTFLVCQGVHWVNDPILRQFIAGIGMVGVIFLMRSS
jgi:hypothetical protein